MFLWNRRAPQIAGLTYVRPKSPIHLHPHNNQNPFTNIFTPTKFKDALMMYIDRMCTCTVIVYICDRLKTALCGMVIGLSHKVLITPHYTLHHHQASSSSCPPYIYIYTARTNLFDPPPSGVCAWANDSKTHMLRVMHTRKHIVHTDTLQSHPSSARNTTPTPPITQTTNNNIRTISPSKCVNCRYNLWQCEYFDIQREEYRKKIQNYNPPWLQRDVADVWRYSAEIPRPDDI